MAPTPFSESNFSKNLHSTIIPIHHKNSSNSSSNLCRNLVNNSTRTDVQNILKQSILQAKRDLEDYAESQSNVLLNNYNNELNKPIANLHKSFGNTMSIKPTKHHHIKRKGPFFEDPFFEECQWPFEKSVREIVNKCGLIGPLHSKSIANKSGFIGPLHSEDLTYSLDNEEDSSFRDNTFKSYRDLRDMMLSEENQAASHVQDEHQHKIVIDVKDFMGGDIKVNSFNNTIRIEGSQDVPSQSPQNSSSSKRKFCKEFTLPGVVNTHCVRSTMSSDGILAITVPRAMYLPTAGVPFPRKSNMAKSSSQMAKSPSQMTQSPSKHSNTNPQMTDCQSYSRQSHGGYWKR